MVDWWQFAQGGSKVGSWERSVQNYVILTGISEQPDFKIGDLKKKYWGIFYHCRMDLYTHFQHTFMLKKPCKVNVASDDPFNKTYNSNSNYTTLLVL